MIPLAYEERDGEVKYVGRSAVPDAYSTGVPILKANIGQLDDGRRQPGQWWLDDGEKEWRVFNLTPEQQKYPYRDSISAKTLARNISRGWDPEWDFHGPDAREFRIAQFAKARSTQEDEHRDSVFNLFFPSLPSAEKARRDLLARGVIDSIEIHDDDFRESAEVAGDNSILLTAIVRRDVIPDLDVLDEIFEEVALEFGGVYDGNTIAL